MTLKSKFLPFVWSKLAVAIILLVSVTIGYSTHDFIDEEKLSTIIEIFSFLPFTAVAYMGGIFYISFSISSVKGLSVTEQASIEATLSSRRWLYAIMGAINLLIGLCAILLYVFTNSMHTLRLLIACAVYIAGATIILCVLEQFYLNSFKHLIEDRTTKREEKKKLLKE